MPCFHGRVQISFALLLLVILPGSALAGVGDIHLTDVPVGLIAREDTVSIGWLEPMECQIRVGLAGGEWIDTLTTVTSSPGELSLAPLLCDLPAGVWTASIFLPGADDSSLPFHLFVEADNAALMVSPQNGGEVEGGSTLLSWEPVLGVPYYHVLFSDQEIVIGEDEHGDATISGANMIWQVIVSGSSVAYGDIDPSGAFVEMNGTSPPLVPGPQYNWLVLNNYGNNPALTSTVQAGVSAFTVTGGEGITPPTLISPSDMITINSDEITFEWSEVPAAAHYHFYLSRLVDDEGSSGAVSVYDQITAQPLLDLPVASILVDSRYQWRVFALDETGQGAASETREFIYEIEMGELSIRTQGPDGGALPFVDIDIQPLDGGGNPIPVFTGSGGTYSDDFVPGNYRLTATKQGYESVTAEVTVVASQIASITLDLLESPATVAGMVRNGESTPVPFAAVIAVNVQSAEIREIQCGASGEFQLGLSAGSWDFTAIAEGYHGTDPVLVTVEPGSFYQMPSALQVLANNSTLNGSVVTTTGQAIVAATVEITDGSTTQTLLTGSDGLFQFSLATGTWTVVASKAGFVSSPPRQVILALDEDLTLNPPLTLSADAAIVSGFVLAGGNVVTGATITASPATGSAVTSQSGALGNFELSLSPGTWVFTAAKDGYSPLDPVQLTLTADGGQSGVELLLSQNPCSVSGIVTDGQQGIGGVTVSNGQIETETTWNGTYTLTLQAGSQVLESWKNGYGNTPPQTLELAPGQVLTGIDFLLSPNAATISGQVRHDQTPVVGAELHLAMATDTLIRTCDGEGNFTVSITPGTFTLWAEKTGMISSSPVTLTLAPGQALSGQVIQLTPATSTLSGLVDDGTTPLREVTIRIARDGDEAVTTTNLDGSWALSAPAGFSWQVTASKIGFGTETVTTPVLASGGDWGHNFSLTSQPALLTVQVGDDDGYAVSGAAVTLTGPVNTQVITDQNGAFQISLLPGTYQLAITQPGYAPHEQDLTLVTGTRELEIQLIGRFASLSGLVTDLETGTLLSGVALTAVSEGGSGSASTGGDGSYNFPRLIAGDYQLQLHLSGYDPLSVALTFGEDETPVRDWQLTPLLGYMSGLVTDGAGSGLGGVVLEVRDGETLLTQTLSLETGEFLFESLPEGLPLSIGASLSGYAVTSTNPLVGLLSPQEGLSFILEPNSGVIQGYVLDLTTYQPIAGSSIAVDDGEGYFGQGISDITGFFRIENLRPGSLYTLVADAPGWAEIQMTGLAADSTMLEIILTSAPSAIFGEILPDRDDTTELIVTGSVLRASPLEVTGRLVEIEIEDIGDYHLPDLLPGQYNLVLKVDGYITDPLSQMVVVGENQQAGPYDFQLISAPLATITIGGEDGIDNNGSYLFQGAQATAEGVQVDYPLVWSCTPADAGEMESSTGRFIPRNNYIGEVELTAKHLRSGLQGSKMVGVYANLDGSESISLDNGAGLTLEVPEGAVAQAVRITVQRKTPSPIKRRAGSYRLADEIFHFLPDGLDFEPEAEPNLKLPVPNDLYNHDLAMGWWDPELLRWSPLPGVKWLGGYAADLAHFSDYAVLVANEALAVKDAVITPNPFSPGAGQGAAISFTVTGLIMNPLVDIDIFNLLGDPVRKLCDDESVMRGVLKSFYWNGLTDENQLARNGRYLVRITVKDNSGTREKILQAVLIK